MLLAGCVSVSMHQAVDKGATEEGGYSRSKDSQEQSDISSEIASRVSGIDKSNQEITKNLDKQNQMLKQSRDRDHEIDKVSPDVPKSVRKDIYKRDSN